MKAKLASAPQTLAKKLGIKILKRPNGKVGNLKRYSEYRVKPPTIILYDTPGPSVAERIYHEIFHHLEAVNLKKPLENSEKVAREFAHCLVR